MKKAILLMAVLLVLTSCATTPSQNGPALFDKPEKMTDSLELLSLGYGQAQGIDGIYPCVEGIVHNVSDKTIGYAEIDINYFDKQGNQVYSVNGQH